MDSVRARLQELMLEKDISAADLSRRIGRNQTYIQQFMSKGSPRRLPEIERGKIAAILEVDEVELGAPNVPDFTRGSFDDDPPPEFDEGTPRIGNGKRVHLKPGTIPEFDLRAGMSYGGGYVIESQVTDGDYTYSAEAVRAEWGIPPAFLQGELRLTPARTHVLAVDGPSMVPDLMPGDRVLIDLTHTDPRQGGIFAVREDGGVIIKHVEIVRGSDPPRIICKSSNQTYSPFELVLDGERVAIIGRVAGRISRM
jgi:transcriptional regulator with XRE-family HTH domain